MTSPEETAQLKADIVELRIDHRAINQRMTTLERQAAVDEERQKQVLEKLDGLKVDYGKLNGHLTWIIRVLVGAIIAAFITFMVKGGLHVAP
ncbi:hemolysin XhlA family protein [Aurantimonas sp. VKM B-3413]|uniref:hemolysin XhlA family protein n=1 Tax=Aurantimonas sp. VKM B-3413 TaxID=2779401 RepID=UPI001E5B8C85|nr:hemolysin XhlA family protein [Aurantimonas sp. VKM B-3413]MCB8835917.1 hemolysin XhlA family protein [Aurantimonas sp. VKM B-3413]